MNWRCTRTGLWCSIFATLGAITHLPATAPGSEGESHPLDAALTLARRSLQHSEANVQDYTAVLVKRLRIDGELGEYQFLALKLRNGKRSSGRVTTPMAVYLKFLKPDSKRGREVIWVEGKNQGKLIAHEAGFTNLLRVKLKPTGVLAMRGQRYPITDIGMQNLLLKLIETAERDRQHGECQVEISESAKVDGKACTMVQVTHPVKQPHFDFYRAQVYFDRELNLPIHYSSWSWPLEEGGEPLLEEEYTYKHVKVNVGLTDRDFDPDNPDYDFP